MSNVSLATALGALRVIEAQADRAVNLGTFGVSEADYAYTTGETPWMGNDRHRVVPVLEAMLTGALERIGVSEFEVPAEYVAAVIFTFVHPANQLLAARWMERQRSAADIAGAGGIEELRGPQLYALVLEIYGTEFGNDFRERFEKRFNVSARKTQATKKEVDVNASS